MASNKSVECSPENSSELFSESPTGEFVAVMEAEVDKVTAEENLPDDSALIDDPSWGDIVEQDEILVPEALRHLEASGITFKVLPKSDFNSGGTQPVIQKNFSVYFTFDTIVTSQDILFGFEKAGIDIDDITSLQRKTSNRLWVVSFCSMDTKEVALSLPSVTISGCQVFLGDSENRTVLVKIYEAPEEMPNTFLIGWLSCCGRVISFRRGICNRIRTARMLFLKPIPSSITVAGENIFIFYPSQPCTYRKCGQEGHMAGSCNQIRCFNCDQVGHRIEECHQSEACKICRESSHPMSFCPFFVYSADVESSSPDNVSYSTAAKSIVEGQKEQNGSGNAADLQKTKSERKNKVRQKQQQPEQKKQPEQKEQKKQPEQKKQQKEREPKQVESERREMDREDDERREKERKERQEQEDREAFEEWKRRQRREEERRDRSRDCGDHYHRHDYACDRSSRRHSRSHSPHSGDESEGWQTVSRRRHHRDYY